MSGIRIAPLVAVGPALLVGACTIADEARDAASGGTVQAAQANSDAQPRQSPPAPAQVPPNRCVAQAFLISATDGPDASTLRLRLPEPDAERLVSLRIRIDSVTGVGDNLDNMCIPDSTIDALTATPPPPELIGQAVEVELELLGSSEGTRWWLHGMAEADTEPQGRAGGNQ